MKIKRTDGKGVELITDEFGLVIVYQQTTMDEHSNMKTELEEALDIIPSADIFYAWGSVSIFVFEMGEFTEETRKEVINIFPKVKRSIIFNGEIVSNSINGMYVTANKKEIKVGKKFHTLFTMKKGD